MYVLWPKGNNSILDTLGAKLGNTSIYIYVDFIFKKIFSLLSPWSSQFKVGKELVNIKCIYKHVNLKMFALFKGDYFSP